MSSISEAMAEDLAAVDAMAAAMVADQQPNPAYNGDNDIVESIAAPPKPISSEQQAAADALTEVQKRYWNHDITKVPNSELVSLAKELWWIPAVGGPLRLDQLDLEHIRNILITEVHASIVLKAVMAARLLELAKEGEFMRKVEDNLEGDDGT